MKSGTVTSKTIPLDTFSEFSEETVQSFPSLLSIESILKGLPDYGRPTILKEASHSIITRRNFLYCGIIDGSIKIYSLEEKSWIGSLQGHNDQILLLKLSKDGSYMCSHSRDGTVRIWNPRLMQHIAVLEGIHMVNDLGITNDNKLLVTASTDSGLIIWNLEDGQKLKKLEGHSEVIICIQITKNNFLFSAGEDKAIRVWSLETKFLIAILEGHTENVNCLKLTSQENWVLSCSNDGTIRFWDVAETRVEAVIHTGMKNIPSIKISKNGKYFAFAREQIKIWGLLKRKEIASFKLDLHDYVEDIKFSRDSRFLIAGLFSGSIKIYNIKLAAEVESLKLHDQSILTLCETDERNWLIANTVESIGIWSLEKNDFSLASNGDLDSRFLKEFEYIHIAADGQNFFSSICDTSIICWDAIENCKIGSLQGHHSKIKCLEITKDGEYLISGSYGEIKVWNVENRKWITDLSGNLASILVLFVTADNKYLLSGSKDKFIKVWSIGNWNEIASLEGHGSDVLCIEETKDFAISGGADCQICLWNKNQWDLDGILFGHSKAISCLKVFSNMRFLISGSDDKTIRIWNISIKAQIAVISGHTDAIKCLKLTKNEKYAVSSSLDKTIKIWDIDERKEIVSLDNSDVANCIELIDNDKFIIAGLNDGKMILWSFVDWNKIATITDHKRPIKLVKSPYEDWKIIAGSRQNVEVYDLQKLISHPTQLKEISTYSDKLYKTMTKISIKKVIRAEDDESIKRFSDITIYPLRINCLHYYCYFDNISCLSKVLNYEPPIIRDLNGSSPLTYAITKKSRRCIDEILLYLSKIKDEKSLLISVHAIRDDIPHLFEIKLKNLVLLLACIFKSEKDELVGFAVPKKDLPNTIFSPTVILRRNEFVYESDSIINKEETLVQFWASYFGWNFSMGSSESLNMLKAINNRKEFEIYRTDFIRTLIKLKWDSLKCIILAQSLVFWANIALMIFAVFTQDSSIFCAFILVNIFLGLYEVVQIYADFWGCISDPWFYIDTTRLAMCLIWSILTINDDCPYPLTYFTAAINFARGSSYFRAFDMTRFYVRLILHAVYDAISFLVILLYSILSFSVIYASTDQSMDIISVWKNTYELEIGQFDNDGFSILQYLYFTVASLINVIVLLNLLVSVLGDSFSRLKEITQEIDLEEMLRVIIEIETVLFWRRNHNQGKRQYMQRCDYFQENVKKDALDENVKELREEIRCLKQDIIELRKNAINKEWLKEEIQGLYGRLKIRDMEAFKEEMQSLENKIEKRDKAFEEKIDEMLNEMRQNR
ncbi:unnamed protein product [Blepharisma stoltei]|uniref:Ion transport domain-containing protein n=1 Tax=Blepharisma stoltei TaxID=1481888 RepID=A0AAU9KJF3_9CILI|nr:unnamed protein product [Blepharisma stoltei]